MCEIVWVLKRAYGYDKPLILNILNQLLQSQEILISSPTEAWAAFQYYADGNADFSDYFIAQLNKNNGCPFTYSFDKKACQHQYFRLLF